jgi:hypothetical protein
MASNNTSPSSGHCNELIDSITSAGFDIEEEYHPDNDKEKAVFLVARKKI